MAHKFFSSILLHGYAPLGHLEHNNLLYHCFGGKVFKITLHCLQSNLIQWIVAISWGPPKIFAILRNKLTEVTSVRFGQKGAIPNSRIQTLTLKSSTPEVDILHHLFNYLDLKLDLILSCFY